MTMPITHCILRTGDEHHELADYQSDLLPRWCSGCGDNAILAAMQRLCRDQNLAPEKMARPDLHVFVSTGDGDCLSIGAAHWLHALRYNMDLTVLLHDNHIYGLTKKQVSPTSPLGTKSNHKGLSFVRILQRCPEFMPGMFDPWVQDPQRTQMLSHRDGITISPALSKIYRNQREHDPADLAAAREIASVEDPIPVGILYRDESVPRYEELRHAGALRTPARLRRGLEAELDKFTIWPDAAPVGA